jgi:hypothetical protein
MRSLVFACLALCLAGCSSDDDSGGAPASGGSAGADSGTGGSSGGSGGSTGGSAGSGSGGTPTDAGGDAPYARQNLLFESTFDESAPLDQWNNAQHCCDYSVQISTDFAKAGAHSIRFELHEDDPVVSSGKRSEVSLDGEPDPETERWVGVSFYLPASWSVDNTPESIIQWHHPSGTGSPPLSLWIEDGVYKLVHSTDSAGNDFSYEELGNADTEVWTDVVFHIKWSKSSSGHLELFLNGTSVFTYDGITTYDLPEGNYLKLGIYKWPWLDSNSTSVVDERVLYADELRVGSELATYLDVAP